MGNLKHKGLRWAIGAGIIACILFALFAPYVLPFLVGFFIGAVLLYALLAATPAEYDEEEQEMTEDEILFVYDDTI